MHRMAQHVPNQAKCFAGCMVLSAFGTTSSGQCCHLRIVYTLCREAEYSAVFRGLGPSPAGTPEATTEPWCVYRTCNQVSPACNTLCSEWWLRRPAVAGAEPVVQLGRGGYSIVRNSAVLATRH